MEGPLRPPPDPGFRLIETCRWTPGEGVHLRARHLARLRASAERLGIVPEGVEAALDQVAGHEPLRLRLTVDASGRTEVSQQPFAPLHPGTCWRLGIATARVRADDPWRQVKTTERGLYDRARAALPVGVEELLFLNERGELCEGTITTLFVDLGQGLLTPPLGSGVLPGVLRAEMLARGDVSECTLTPRELLAARAIFVGNALRGLIPARLA